MRDHYSRETIDAKLDAIRADGRALDAKLSGQFAALDAKLSGHIIASDGQFAALDARLSGQIGSLRTEMRVWLIVVGLIVSPVLAGIGSRVASAIPFPPPAGPHGAQLR